MSQNEALKMLAAMLLSFLIIAGATQTGPALLPGVTASEEAFSEGTMIGRTNVAGLSNEEAESAVTEDVLNWKQQSGLVVTYGEQSAVLQPELVDFFPAEAVNTAQDGVSNPIPLNVNMSDVITLLSKDFGLLESAVLDPVKVQSEIENRISFLDTAAESPIELSLLLASGSGETLIAEAAGDFTVTAGQQNYIFKNESVTLLPGEYYSVLNLSNQVLESIEDYEVTDEELSKIATVIHSAVLETPLTIAERHISTRLPVFAAAGKEARVTSSNNNDYKILNATQSDFTINAESIQGTLYVRITGPEQPFTYQTEIGGTDMLPFRTIRQYSAFVADGVVEVTEPGLDGQIIPVERITLDVDSYEINREFLYEDFYPPVHRVEVSSLETPEQLAEDGPEEQADDPEKEGEQRNGDNTTSNDSDESTEERSDRSNPSDNSSGSENGGPDAAPGNSSSDQNGDSSNDQPARKENHLNDSVKQETKPK